MGSPGSKRIAVMLCVYLRPPAFTANSAKHRGFPAG